MVLGLALLMMRLLAVLNGDYIADSRVGLCVFAKTGLG
jgi:hypothetical protein